MLKENFIPISHIWNLYGNSVRCNVEIYQVIHHILKTVKIDIKEHPIINIPWQALFPHPTKDSLNPHYLDMCQGGADYVYDPPPPLFERPRLPHSLGWVLEEGNGRKLCHPCTARPTLLT